MKKLLSILLSAVLCASVILVNPDVMDLPNADADNIPGIEVEYDEGETSDSMVEPCDERWPPYGEDI